MISFLTRTHSWLLTVYPSSSSIMKFSLIWNFPNHVIFELMKCVIIWTFQNLSSERFLANITTLWMFILDFVLHHVIEILLKFKFSTWVHYNNILSKVEIIKTDMLKILLNSFIWIPLGTSYPAYDLAHTIWYTVSLNIYVLWYVAHHTATLISCCFDFQLK